MTQPVGSRIKSLTYLGKPIDVAQEFVIADLRDAGHQLPVLILKQVADSAALASAVIRLTNPIDGDAERLRQRQRSHRPPGRWCAKFGGQRRQLIGREACGDGMVQSHRR